MNVKSKGGVKYLEIIGEILRKLLESGGRVPGKLFREITKICRAIARSKRLKVTDFKQKKEECYSK